MKFDPQSLVTILRSSDCHYGSIIVLFCGSRHLQRIRWPFHLPSSRFLGSFPKFEWVLSHFLFSQLWIIISLFILCFLCLVIPYVCLLWLTNRRLTLGSKLHVFLILSPKRKHQAMALSAFTQAFRTVVFLTLDEASARFHCNNPLFRCFNINDFDVQLRVLGCAK